MIFLFMPGKKRIALYSNICNLDGLYMKIERWKLNLYFLWFAQIISLMSFGFGIPFIPYYIQELGVTDPVSVKLYSGLLNSLPGFAMGIMAPIWGFLADKVGRKMILLRATFFGILVLGGMGIVQNVEQLLFARIMQGVFTGTVTASYALVASQTPDDKMSYALGLMASSNFIGSSVGPFIGGLMAEQYGYRISFLIGASLMVLDFLIILFSVKEENKPKWSDYKAELKEKKGKPRQKIQLRKVITPLFFVILSVLFFVKIGGNMAAPYISIFIQETRGTLTGSSAVTGAINGAVGLSTALAGLTISRAGDKKSKKKILFYLLIGTIIASIPLYFIDNIIFFATVYCFLFFLIGGAEPMLMSLMSEKTPKEKRGLAFGIYSLVANMGWAVSPLIGSAVTIFYDTKSVFLSIPVFFLIALIILVRFSGNFGNEEIPR